MNNNRRYIILLVILLLALPCLFLLDILLGSVNLGFSKSVNALFGSGDAIDVSIVQSIRLPKATTAILAGMALAVCGVLMQTLFRNPLAGPYVLGVNSGASFGVALVIIGNSVFNLNDSGSVLKLGILFAAVAGALGVLVIILGVSVKIRNNMGLLLAGIMLGQIISAAESLLEYFGDADSVKSFVLWNMASVSNVSNQDLVWMAPITVLFTLASLLLIKDLDVLLMGDAYATSMGLDIKKKRLLIIILTGILSGVTTAFCGPVAFIGIAVPHIVRILMRSSVHKYIIPLCLLMGPCIMLFCDIICQLPSKGIVLPLNVITATIGAPIVLYLLFKNYKFIN